jgi:hypothetical protein
LVCSHLPNSEWPMVFPSFYFANLIIHDLFPVKGTVLLTMIISHDIVPYLR